MPPTNKALYLQAAKDPSMTISEAPYPSCGPDELIIRTTAVAINPADVIIQKTGMLLTKYPAILGCDAAGIVVESRHPRFQPGDHVFGATSPLKDYKYAGFQEYVVLKAPSIAKVPENVKDSEAVVLPLGLNTAASCLFAEETLNLRLPGDNAGEGKMVLIWGASGSVGSCAVQLAKAAGYEVLTIASEKNHGILREMGVGKCFDYHDPDMAKRVTEKLKGRRVVRALDAISKRETIGTLCEILDEVDAEEKVVAAVQPGAEAWAKDNVVVKTNFGVNRETFENVSELLWADFLPAALREGRFQCKPVPEIVGQGLENVQQAMNLLEDGVSANKLVVTIG